MGIISNLLNGITEILDYTQNNNGHDSSDTAMSDESMKQPQQAEEEPESNAEEADSDPFPEENVIDATFREIPQSPAQTLGNIFNAAVTQDNAHNVGQAINGFIGSLNISDEDKEKVKHRRGREMDSLSVLTAKRDDLLGKIRAIEESCEGIENGNNAKRVQELNLEKVQLSAQKQEVSARLAALETRLSEISAEITKLSGTGIKRILAAIKDQRWYFLKNYPKVLLDKTTGLLWANLKMFPYGTNNNTNGYSLSSVENIIQQYDFGLQGFRIPDCYELWNAVCDKTLPFSDTNNSNWRIKGKDYWCCMYDENIRSKDLDGNGPTYGIGTASVCVLPCSSFLVNGTNYKENVSPDNSIYTENERLQFTLDLFVQNGLRPIFNDIEITKIYDKVYFRKPALLAELQEIQSQIESLQEVTLLSSGFDYTALLSRYDIPSIDVSIIKYYQAIQQWCMELMDKLDYYEKEKEAVIRDFNVIGLKLSRKYENNTNLTEKERTLLLDRQKYFKKNFSLGMNSIRSKILAIKKQADDLEYRIDEIDNGEDAIRELAILEQEQRASFSFIAENTAKIIKNALLKIEFFEAHHDFVKNAIDIWEKWTESYRVFKTTYREDMKGSCGEDGIEEEVWSVWYHDWQQLRYAVEEKVQPMIERGLKGEMPAIEERKASVPEQILSELEIYRDNIDSFYREERKGIYQKFVFQSGGELQDKFEAESSLYKYVAQFQSALQDIIFNCKNAEDRVFILNWADSLLDIQIDEILDFVANNDLQKISRTILDEFAALKQKNYDIYLADVKAYSEEKARREREYNSLIFKMRKDLMKQ